MTALATAFVEIRPDTSKLGPELQRDAGSAADRAGTDSGKRFSSRFGGALKVGALLAGAFAVTKGAQFFRESISEASDLNESLNAVNVSFGKNASGIKRLGEDAANAVGLSNNEFNGLAVQFSAFAGVIAGKGGDVVGTIDDLSRRGADFASVMNLDVSDAMELFQSGLAGETEPLRKFGIDLSAAAVTAHAYKTGIAAAGAELTENQKVQARYSLLMQQTSKAQGDFANTSDGLANSQRILGANVDNIQAKFGKIFIPILEKLTGLFLREGIPRVELFATKLGELAKAGGDAGFFAGITAAVSGVDWGSASDGLAKIADSIKSADWGALRDGIGQGVGDTITVFAVAIGFAADHVDDFAKVLPLLIAGFVAYKAAQAAANVLAIASIPLQVAQIGANLALAAANRSLATQMAITSGVERVGLFSRVASTVATYAAATAAGVAAGAAKVWAAGQWLLNAALSANPIGLVVVAIAALVAGLVYAYKNSETFRNIVNAAFTAIRDVAGGVLSWLGGAVKSTIDFVRGHWKLILGILTGPIGAAAVLIISNFGKIKSAGTNVVEWVKAIPGKLKALGALFGEAGRSLIGQFVDGLKNAAGVITGMAGNIWAAVRKLINGGIDKINAALEFTISLPGPDLHINPSNIPHLATGARVTAPTLALIGEGREAETVLPDSKFKAVLGKARAAGAAERESSSGNVFNVYETTSAAHTAAEVSRLLAFAGGA